MNVRLSIKTRLATWVARAMYLPVRYGFVSPTTAIALSMKFVRIRAVVER